MEETALVEQITLLRIEMGKLGTKIDSLNSLSSDMKQTNMELDAVSKVAEAAKDNSIRAHKRLNDMVVTVRWIIGVSIPTIGLMLTMATILYNILKK